MANQQHTLVMVQPNHPTFIHTLPLSPIPPVVVPMQNYPPFWWNYAYRILQYAISLFFTNFCNAEKWIKCIKEYNWKQLLCNIFCCLNWCYCILWLFNSICCLCFYFSFSFFSLSLSVLYDLFVCKKKCKKIQSWIWWQCSSKIFVISMNNIIGIDICIW